MRRAMTPDEFANLVGLSREEVETYRSLGLLDPEQDGLLDDVDLVRLGFVRHRLAQDAYNPESLAVAIREGRVDSMYGRRLFESDVEIFEVTRVARDAGLPWEAMLGVTRVLGDSLRRIADSEIRVVQPPRARPESRSESSE